MKIKAIIIFLLLILVSSGKLIASSDSLLQVLDRELLISEKYAAKKQQNIFRLKQQLRDSVNPTPTYNLLDSIFQLYKSFHYDSAFRYVKKMRDLAYQQNDRHKIVHTKIETGFIFISSGMFKEAEDTLSTVGLKGLPDELKQEYYKVMSILFYGLADLQDSHYAPIYETRANKYIDSVLMYSTPGTYDDLYYRGLRSIRRGEYEKGAEMLNRIQEKESLSDHQQAIIYSTLSDAYINLGDEDKAIQLLTKASLLDIRDATRETSAILYLANLIFRRGDIKRAYVYTKKALDDANFYGARHRKIQVSSILPIVEEEKINTVESQKKTLMIYAIALTLLSIIIIVFIVIILRQLSRIKKADQAIVETNNELRRTNQKLQESNKIKEEYIGYYFHLISNYIERLEILKANLDQSLSNNKFDTVRYIVQNIRLKNERQKLYEGFDRIFLNLFPDFVEKFNKLFAEEDRISISDNELLNTDLRIFALIRLGISENDKIANILGLSVNTIYTYKTRIKNKSRVPNEDFEKKILEIRVI